MAAPEQPAASQPAPPPPQGPFRRMMSRFMRLFFHLLYHQLAWSYDLVAWIVSLGLWKGWVLSVLPYLSGPHILELGHGPGHLEATLWQEGLHPVGLDESRQMSAKAYRRLFYLLKRDKKLPKLVNGYAQFLPFQNHAFDQVVATFPSDYIVAPSTLSEIYRILKPGGELLILPFAWITDQRLHYRLAAGLFRLTGETPDFESTIHNPHFLAPLRLAGFHASAEWIIQPSSRLLLIRAKKESPSGSSQAL